MEQKIVFDSRLGRRGGSRYRDKCTGHFAPRPKNPCPPHWWIIDSQNIGRCRKCNAVKNFAVLLRKYLRDEKEKRREKAIKSRPAG
jgi:hypothetical protein